MKIPKNPLFLLVFLMISSIAIAQENVPEEFFQEDEPKVRPIRIGAKIGFPNLIGGNLEYVTPMVNNKLSVSVDYSIIKSDWILNMLGEDLVSTEDGETSSINYNYIEGGLNYYFFKPGRGLYGGVSYGIVNIKGTLYDVYSNDENNADLTGTGTIDFSHSSINLKLGAKLGGLFYFRPEVGYSFSSLPNSIDMEVVYEDGSRETRTEEIYDPEGSPGSLLGKGFMVNIGLGFAF